MSGTKQGNADAVHGSLLAFRELFLHANMFMKPHFTEVGDTILLYKDHKDSLIRKTVIILIPTLALYDTQSFSEKYLHKSMAHLLGQLKKPDRDLGECVVSKHTVSSSSILNDPQPLRRSGTSPPQSGVI